MTGTSALSLGKTDTLKTPRGMPATFAARQAAPHMAGGPASRSRSYRPAHSQQAAVDPASIMRRHDQAGYGPMTSFRTSTLGRGAALVAVVAALVLVGAPDASDAASVYCHTGNPMTGVHDPARLIVRSACQQAAGKVTKVYIEHDGDYHISMTGVRSSLLNSKNNGTLVVERVPRFPLALPKVGSQITVTGPWVTDKATGWNEIHPVWHISVQSGGLMFSTAGRTVGNPAKIPFDPNPVDEADEH